VVAADVAPEFLPQCETQPPEKSTSWASKVDGARNKVHKQMSSLLQKGRAWGTCDEGSGDSKTPCLGVRICVSCAVK